MPNDVENELMHYGILGMKWGIRSARRSEVANQHRANYYKGRGEAQKKVYDNEAKLARTRAEIAGESGTKSGARYQKLYESHAKSLERRGDSVKKGLDATASSYQDRANRYKKGQEEGNQMLKEYQSLSKKDRAKVNVYEAFGGTYAAQRYSKALANAGNKKMSDAYKKQARNRALAANAMAIAGGITVIAVAMAKAKAGG